MLEVKQSKLNRKQTKFLRELGVLADRMSLSAMETWQTMAHYVSYLKENYEKGLIKLEKKGYINIVDSKSKAAANKE